MFAGSKEASRAGVEGQISTSRQTDFDNERQNTRVASNKHVSMRRTDSLKHRTKGLKWPCVVEGVEHFYL